MNEKEFFELYLPALELALKNDDENESFFVKSPDYYIEKNYLSDIDLFIENNVEYADFFDKVGYYFDAKSHYFEEIQGIAINVYKQNILELIAKLKNINY